MSSSIHPNVPIAFLPRKGLRRLLRRNQGVGNHYHPIPRDFTACCDVCSASCKPACSWIYRDGVQQDPPDICEQCLHGEGEMDAYARGDI